MLNKALLATAIAASISAPSAVLAQQGEPKSPHTLTGNVGLFSQYIFRGLTQTDRQPAVQGGFDYAHESGVYLGTWASNISWLRDFGGYSSGGSVEWDFYGGYKGSFGQSDFGYDVGLLYYYYPGRAAAGAVKADTFEIYGALSWKWLSAKYSYGLKHDTFGVQNSDGTSYLDLTASFPVTDKFSLLAHWGRQKYRGNTGAFNNDTNASYDDWKLGATYALPKDFTVGAFFSGTDMSSVQKAFYTTPVGAGSRFVGADTFTVYVQKTF